MKKLVIFLVLISCGAVAQVKAPETDFILQNGSVFWKHTFELKGKDATEIAALLDSKFSAAPRVSAFSRSAPKITFRIEDDKPNLKLYGAKRMTTSIIAQLYMKYDVAIDVTKDCYTVTLTNIVLDNKDLTERKSGEISKFVCNLSNLTFKTDEIIQNGLKIDNRFFIDRFTIESDADKK